MDSEMEAMAHLPCLTDPGVIDFKVAFQLPDAPVMVAYSDYGYEPDWCHVSAKAHALKHGGKRIHGWSLWVFPNGILGEFHSVWETPEGDLVDVTPPKFGETKVVFLRDPKTDIMDDGSAFGMPNNRMAPPHPMFWFDGLPTSDSDWAFSRAAPSFVSYCNKVGLAADQYATP